MEYGAFLKKNHFVDPKFVSTIIFYYGLTHRMVQNKDFIDSFLLQHSEGRVRLLREQQESVDPSFLVQTVGGVMIGPFCTS